MLDFWGVLALPVSSFMSGQRNMFNIDPCDECQPQKHQQKKRLHQKNKNHDFLNYFGGFNTSEKHMLVKLDHVPRDSR